MHVGKFFYCVHDTHAFVCLVLIWYNWPLVECTPLPIFFRVTSLALGQLYNSLRPSDAYMHQQTNRIGSDNGLSPGRRHAIIWTNAGILLIGPFWTNFSQILIAIHTFSLKKLHFKMSSGECRPQCWWPPCQWSNPEGWVKLGGMYHFSQKNVYPLHKKYKFWNIFYPIFICRALMISWPWFMQWIYTELGEKTPLESKYIS